MEIGMKSAGIAAGPRGFDALFRQAIDNLSASHAVLRDVGFLEGLKKSCQVDCRLDMLVDAGDEAAVQEIQSDVQVKTCSMLEAFGKGTDYVPTPDEVHSFWDHWYNDAPAPEMEAKKKPGRSHGMGM